MSSYHNTESAKTRTEDQPSSFTMDSYQEELKSIFSLDQQVAPSKSSNRMLTQAEEAILKTINTCLRDWHKPWIDTFLEDGREFRITYDLMEGLLHYEYQITSSDSPLSSERTTAIAQAVARLIDYGNAILGIDLVIRANDAAFSETDPLRMTTIELFQAHLRAHTLREKLLYDYFKKDKPMSSNVLVHEQEQKGLNLTPSLSPNTLQVPRGSCLSLQPLVVDGRSLGSPRGSTTSINSLDDSGRRTPSQLSQGLPSPKQMDPVDLSQSVEITDMINTIKDRTFSASHSSTTRLTLLPGVLSKIENSLISPANNIKIKQCFDLLDALLDSIERLPDESRDKEIFKISMVLLRPLVKKVYFNDSDDLNQFQHAHWTTCLLSLVRLMGPNFSSYLKRFNKPFDLGAFLTEYLFVVKSLLSSSSSRLTTSSNENSNLKSVIHQGSTYPDCWIDMTLLACSTLLGSLTSLYQMLRQVFPAKFTTWVAFIDCLVLFPVHESLRQDRLLLKERQRMLADNIRLTSAEYVWISWETLNLSQKQQHLEGLMEPLLRASIALHSKHRSVLLPIFYDMMRCDYTVQYITPRSSFCSSNVITAQDHRDGISISSINLDQFNERRMDPHPGYQLHRPSEDQTASNISLPYLTLPQEDGTVLTKFTHLIVGKLYDLIMGLKLGDETFTSELCAAISGDLNPKYYNKTSSAGVHGDTSQFKSMAKQTSDLISEFLQICMDYRQADHLGYKHLCLLCLFKLILFFRDKVDRPELYLSNLFSLSHLHHVAKRHVEAGYTLLEHAKSLPWSDSPLEIHHLVVTKFFGMSQQQLNDSSDLKIFLYNTIMGYFDQGQNWEAAVPLCRELINYYEFKTYEYGKLAQQLDNMSSYFKNINGNSGRSNPEYFRVTFYGKGFPSCLKDMTVIYRGRPYEKLGDFQSFMLSKYPDAKPLSTLSKPDCSILNDPESRYLQINACSPVVDLQSKFPGADIKNIREPLLNYYRHNCCDKFQFSRRVDRSRGQVPVGDDNFANMWRERTTLTTNTFPGMLPFFPVYLIETGIISPIESAIEDLERVNDRLATMVNRFRADERHIEDVRPLGQLLLGVVDAAVNGGISKYEEAFFHDGSRPRAGQQQQQSSPLPPPTPPPTTTAPSAAAAVNPTTNELMIPPSSSENDSAQTSPFTANHAASKVVVDQHEAHDTNTNRDAASTSGCSSLASVINAAQVDKLKYLIAKQVPLLEEAIQLHSDRVAEEMRPQHEHLEASYKKLKHHITTKYHRYLPHEYCKGGSSSFSSSVNTLRSQRSMTRSPRSTLRASTDLNTPRLLVSTEPHQSVSPSSSIRASRLTSKRMSDVGSINRQRNDATSGNEDEKEESAAALSSSIPYRQLANERRSLPFLTCSEPSMMAPSTSTRTRRDSSRDRHANGHYTRHQYDEISGIVVSPSGLQNSTANLNSDGEKGDIVAPPKPFARSSIKIRLPFGGNGNEMRKELLQTSLNDESQYAHLINCDKNDDDDDDDDDGDEKEKEQEVRNLESVGKKKTTSGQSNGNDETNLLSF